METKVAYRTASRVDNFSGQCAIVGGGRPARRSKYNSVKTEVDGIVFDSRHESERYSTLRLLQLSGEIRDLELQPTFQVVVNGKRICKYRADFRYVEVASGKSVVEDAKGMRTAVYRLKKKLVEAIYGIEIVEV